jgi:hypothetical protein
VSYTSEHKRLQPVLAMARKFDIATNPAPEALFEAGSGGFQIWCSPEDRPKGWDSVPMDMGAFAKPCAFVASVWWGWEPVLGTSDETESVSSEAITHLCLETDASDLRATKQRPPRVRNRPGDIRWAKQKIRWLFQQAGVTCPPIRVERD